ncbi:MAG: hypothetical protein A2166_06405 [Omnitrophica WOR_2 bacterium RBG_13_41_10]|nr:MAG: hypothetical protein A2166_06405 [Omnitrophica WOR_2 bacterium RBG_13_41_10]
MNKKGLTLLEILVATMLFALVMTGLANVFLAGKRHLIHSKSRISGAEINKFFLDPLQMDVRQDTWSTAGNCLTSTGSSCSSEARTLDTIVYNVNWSIGPGPITNLRKVTATISWTEPNPNP